MPLLPARLRSALAAWHAMHPGGDAVRHGFPAYVRLWPVNEIAARNADYEVAQNLPGFVAFGDNGGDGLLALDLRGAPGKGAGPGGAPVVDVPFLPMEEASATAVAPSLAAFLDSCMPT